MSPVESAITTVHNAVGKVKWFNNRKGYGFITVDGTYSGSTEDASNMELKMFEEAPDIFVHHSSIVMDGYRSLKEGETVRFTLIESDKGYQAQDVQRVD